MVATAADYPWSSQGHNALGRNQALTTPCAAWSALGDTDETRCARYLALVSEQPQPEELEEIRAAPGNTVSTPARGCGSR
jgi:putative transposase